MDLIKRNLNQRILLIIAGVMGILISVFADSIGVGHPGFGMEQLSGLVIAALVTIAGILKILFPGIRILVRLVAGIYVSGIFYLGLKPNPFRHTQNKIFLYAGSIDWRDFVINTMGFIPLGYLFMLSFEDSRKERRINLFKRAIVVAAAGSSISLFLEVSQYILIVGRQPSLSDWIFNTLGTIVGIALYILMEREPALITRIKGLRHLGDSP